MGAGFQLYAKGSKHAEVLIYEDVGQDWFGGVTAKQFTDDLRALGDLSTIDVRINSYGGDVFDGLAIYNQLVQHKAKVTTHVDGVAASIASVIAMAGDTINIAENGWLMIHDAWGMAVGNAADLRRRADLMDSVTDKLAGVYVARTGLPMAEVRSLMAAETWLSARDAVQRNFATSVTENLRMAASVAPGEHFAFKHVPQALRGAAAPNKKEPVVLTDEERALRDSVATQAVRVQRARLLTNFKSRGAGV